MATQLTAQQVLHGYTMGIFPMADSDDNNTIHWYEPKMRGVIFPQDFKISKSLRQTLRSGKFTITLNRSFEQVMRMCANRYESWISEEIIEVFTELHLMGYGYSFETRNVQGDLVGGLYGVRLGKAFFGESMFHIERDASKVALAYLVEWMKINEMTLLDTQYLTPHLESLGACAIPQEEYLDYLLEAIR
ncbi:MAG: leucyl/phenylalanyl-tRNA--protein transferase [Bacteroidia bacterium]|jgi:leucyl/phenylalanyl-tRNA--protein transferase|nr:leucyl/phenylalanyl-tRNA--protein transferase [Bacteroidia bacterium]